MFLVISNVAYETVLPRSYALTPQIQAIDCFQKDMRFFANLWLLFHSLFA